MNHEGIIATREYIVATSEDDKIIIEELLLKWCKSYTSISEKDVIVHRKLTSLWNTRLPRRRIVSRSCRVVPRIRSCKIFGNTSRQLELRHVTLRELDRMRSESF